MRLCILLGNFSLKSLIVFLTTPYSRRSSDEMWLSQKHVLEEYGYYPNNSSKKNDSKFLVLFTYETRALHDLHISIRMDCTHFCGPFPLVWQIVWRQLHSIIMNNAHLTAQVQPLPGQHIPTLLPH